MLRQPAEPEANRATDRSGADSLDVARGLRGRSDLPSVSASTSSRIRNGVPRVARRQASTKTGSGTLARLRLHELGDRRSRQRREADHLGGRIGRHAREQLGIGARLARAGRQDERDVQLFEPREQKGQVAQRGGVCPVRVVDDDAERAGGGQVRAQPVEAVQDRERGIDARRVRRRPQRVRPEAEQGGRHAGGVLQQIGALELRCLGQRRLEKLTHDSEGEIALQLGPARPQHAHPAVCRRRPRRGEQRRLADPGRPLDHHEPAAPGASLGQGRFDPRQLLASFEERSGGLAPSHMPRAHHRCPELGALATVRWRTREFPARRW